MGIGEGVTKERLNIIFLLDHSGSMVRDARIDQLNHAMPDAFMELRKVAKAEEAEVSVRVIAFNSQVDWIMGSAQEGVDIENAESSWHNLDASGKTDTAGAINLCLTALRTQYLGTRNFHPVVVLVTDGRSNDFDATKAAIAKLKTAMSGSTGKEKIIRIAVGVKDYNEEELKAFASTGIVNGEADTPLVFKVDDVEQLSQCLKGIAVSSLYSAVNGGAEADTSEFEIIIDPDDNASSIWESRK